MTPLGEILRDEICRSGPVSFRHFMEAALYHPEFGYYRKPRDPFGKSGDFYTAEQLQPVFGILIAQRIRMLRELMGAPEDFAVVELGAGRREMKEALAAFRYIPIDIGTGRIPEHIRGVIFSNEFFDALPVHALVARRDTARELCVGFGDDRFTWVECGAAPEDVECYRKRYLGTLSDGQIFEVNLEALAWMDRIACMLDAGYVFSIDYGYTAAELPRFPAGTLMAYRGHQAFEDVLKNPGEQDITAHVCFTALKGHGERVGIDIETLEPLARTLIAAGEADQFAAALDAPSEDERMRRRLQLKQLLYGLGETFWTVLQRKRMER